VVGTEQLSVTVGVFQEAMAEVPVVGRVILAGQLLMVGDTMSLVHGLTAHEKVVGFFSPKLKLPSLRLSLSIKLTEAPSLAKSWLLAPIPIWNAGVFEACIIFRAVSAPMRIVPVTCG
jgi:hypothetical protein